jgi:hypothetical protein
MENNPARQPETALIVPRPHDMLRGLNQLRAEVDADFAEFGVRPLRLVQGGLLFADIRGSLDSKETVDRPFAIYEVEGQDSSKMIYKKRIRQDPRNSARNEIAFYRDISPAIRSLLPASSRIKIPAFINANLQDPALLEEFIDGQSAGGIHIVREGVLDASDLSEIARFIKTMQGIPYGKILRLGGMTLGISLEEDYETNFEQREPFLHASLGNQDTDRLKDIIKSASENFDRFPPIFAGVDIQPSNIIKTSDGKIGLVDWERVSATRNPALDYSFLFTDLWDNPELQESFFHEILDLNKDVPNFKEFLRLDFMLNRGSGELAHWQMYSEDVDTHEERERCGNAIDRHSKLLVDALNTDGLWAA